MSRLGGPQSKALAWGLLWAVIGGLVLNFTAPNPWPTQASLVTELQASLTVLEHGGPALLGYKPSTHVPFAVGYAQDQGTYVIVPVLSHWLGQSSPIAALRWLWLAAWVFTLLFSAAVFRSIFQSSWAAVLAPPTLLVCILSFGAGDVYWVTAWAIVTLMPPLILLVRNRPRRPWLVLLPIALAAGVATTFRSDAGLPVVLAAAAVAVIGANHWSLRVALLAIVALAYLAPTSIMLPAIREHRDHRIGVDLSANEPTSHPLWHSAYIGLGYTSNRYDIHYVDSYGVAAAREADPRAAFLSPAYVNALHKQVDALIEHDPLFVAKAEAQKAVVALLIASPYILLLALLLPAALSAPDRARLHRSELALFIPALAIGVIPAILAAPFHDYELTLLGPLGVLGLLAIGSAAARAQSECGVANKSTVEVLGRIRLMLRSLVGAWPIRATMVTMVITVAVLTPTVLFARHLEAEHESWESSVSNTPKVVLAADRGGAAPADA
jgi:uncharacterized membrane protein